MDIITRLQHYLDEQHVPYELHRHPTRYTMQEIAAAEHLPGRMVAKVVVAMAGADMILLVLPASRHLNLARLRELFGGKDVRLAYEEEFGPLFPDCDTGAMPPFGNLYGLPVYMDDALAKEEMITCQAGTQTHTLRLTFRDLQRLVQPVMLSFADPTGQG